MIGVADGREAFARAFRSGLRPAPRLTVSEWAEENRILDAGAEPGPWRNERTPYLREVMDSLSVHHPCTRVVFMKGAQIGATEAGNNWLGYIIDQAPANALFVMPTKDDAGLVAKTRIDPMVETCKVLAARVADPKSRSALNSTRAKSYPGGTMYFRGANAPAGFRSVAARYVFMDEVDGYPGDVGGEGDPLFLAERCTRTFSSQKKLFIVSTPTIHGRSRIEREFQLTDRSYHHVPCPWCGFLQRLQWSGIKWDDEDPATARYMCCECERDIEERRKTEMLAEGVWIPEAPELSHRARGFHLSSLYSPVGWQSWERIVETFQEGMGIGSDSGRKPSVLRTWTNLDLGESFREKGEAPPWETLYNRGKHGFEQGTVPQGGLLLTAGLDVQGDRLELEVVAWGRDLRSWSVAYIVIPGDPTNEGPDGPWATVDEILSTDWPLEGTKGGSLRIKRLAADCGHETQVVRRWVRKKPLHLVMGVMGRANMPGALGQPTKVEVSIQGKPLKRGVLEWPVGVDTLKAELYGFLRQVEPTEPEKTGFPFGWCEFPSARGEEWYRQLTAEEIVPKKVRGYTRYEWTKTRERNEALDCRVYARAAATAVGVDRFGEREWGSLEETLGASSSGAPRQRRRGRSRIARRWRTR